MLCGTGAILSFLAGKPVVFVDNSYQKLSSTLKTAFDGKDSCSRTDRMGFLAADPNKGDIVARIIDLVRKAKK